MQVLDLYRALLRARGRERLQQRKSGRTENVMHGARGGSTSHKTPPHVWEGV